MLGYNTIRNNMINDAKITLDTLIITEKLKVSNNSASGILVIPAASAPPTVNIETGSIYFNTAGNSINVYNGTVWKSANMV